MKGNRAEEDICQWKNTCRWLSHITGDALSLAGGSSSARAFPSLARFRRGETKRHLWRFPKSASAQEERQSEPPRETGANRVFCKTSQALASGGQSGRSNVFGFATTPFRRGGMY